MHNLKSASAPSCQRVCVHAAQMPLVLMVRKERDSSVRRPSLSMSAAHLQRSCPGAIHAKVTGDLSTHGRVHIKMASFALSDNIK